MKDVSTTYRATAALLLGLAAAPQAAASSEAIGTLSRGLYGCELPGDAGGERGIAVPEEGFTITNSSTYATVQGGGNYLRKGKTVTMTSGPRKGDRYELKNELYLRKLGEDGSPTGLRCIRMGPAPS